MCLSLTDGQKFFLHVKTQDYLYKRKLQACLVETIGRVPDGMRHMPTCGGDSAALSLLASWLRGAKCKSSLFWNLPYKFTIFLWFAWVGKWGHQEADVVMVRLDCLPCFGLVTPLFWVRILSRTPWISGSSKIVWLYFLPDLQHVLRKAKLSKSLVHRQ